MTGHVVVVGYGRVGQHIVTVLEHLNVPRLVVEQDIGRAVELDQRGTPTLYGNAADSEVLAARYSPDGALLFTAGLDRRLRAWDIATGAPSSSRRCRRTSTV